LEPNGWVRLWRQMRYDEKVQALTDSEFRVWVLLLLIASTNPRTHGQLLNDETGEPLSLRGIAKAIGMPSSVVGRALKRLCEPMGMVTRRPLPYNPQRAVYRVSNFGRYQVPDQRPPEQDRPATGTACPATGTVEQACVPLQGHFPGQWGVPELGHNTQQSPEPSDAACKRTVPLQGQLPQGEVKDVKTTPNTSSSSTTTEEEEEHGRVMRTAHDWFGHLFGLPPDGLPHPWDMLIATWESEYGQAEVRAAAEITHARFCTQTKADQQAVRNYMRKTIERRAAERRTMPIATAQPALIQGIAGWPADTWAIRPEDSESIRAIVTSPDWNRMPPILEHFNGLTALAIQRARSAYEGGSEAR